MYIFALPVNFRYITSYMHIHFLSPVYESVFTQYTLYSHGFSVGNKSA